jgi:hypothetical protein
MTSLGTGPETFLFVIWCFNQLRYLLRTATINYGTFILIPLEEEIIYVMKIATLFLQGTHNGKYK